MKHIKNFKTETQYDSFVNSAEYVEPNISFIKNTSEVKFNRRDHILTFRAIQANSTIALIKIGSPNDISLQYSIDSGITWNTYTIGNTITLTNIGDNVKFKGINSTFSRSISDNYKFQMSGKIAAFGDVTSLLNGVGGDVNLTGKNYCFWQMFIGCKSLVTAPELPSTTLAQYCYSNMFIGCTSLVTAPELPATTLAQSCYGSMFYDCASLTTAPSELPAKRLTQNCYSHMFYGCSSLIIAPKLPATILAESCYASMFQGCTSLVTAPELPAKVLTSNCYYYMFFNCSHINYIKALFTSTPSNTYTQNWVSGVASTGTFVKNSKAQWNVTGTNGIPTGWYAEPYKQNTLIIYVDEFPEDNPQWYDILGHFNTMEEYLDVYLDNLESGGANKYNLTPETFYYDGDIYYVWEKDNDYYIDSGGYNVPYVITDTIDFDTLYGRSIESDYENYSNKFIIILEEDMNVYREGYDALIKIEQN